MGCRGVHSSSKELAGLQAEKQGLQRELSALQSLHQEGLMSTQQEVEALLDSRDSAQAAAEEREVALQQEAEAHGRDRAKLQRELAALRMAHGKAVERSNAAHAAARQERERCKAEVAEARAAHARELASQQSKTAILQQVSRHFRQFLVQND